MSGVPDNFYRGDIPLQESANQRRRREEMDAKVLQAAGISLAAKGVDLQRTLAEGLVNKEALPADPAAPIPYEEKQVPPDEPDDMDSLAQEEKEWVRRQNKRLKQS